MKILKRFFEDKGAVSPVIGVVLMVAITVILAAAIGSSVFGNDVSEKAPQANINVKLGELQDGKMNNSTVILEHLGGDLIYFDNSSLITKITVSVNDGNSIDVKNPHPSINMSVGNSHELILKGVKDPVTVNKTDIVNIKIIDVTTQQLICEKDVRF